MRWVVVGGGSGGCVVAGRLAAGGHEVVLVEAGPSPPPVRASFLDTLDVPGAVFPGSVVRGRGLGGSGAVNGMVATVGELAQYEAWGWTDAAAALARVRVPTEAAAPLGPVDEALLAAAPDATVARLTARHGRRVTAADVYLDGVGVLAGVAATHLELDGDRGRAVAVRLADGRRVEADAVAVAAGAIGTPSLLRASGLTDPEIGAGLRNHTGLPVTLRLRRGVDPHGLVTGAVLVRGDIQVTSMNHLGPSRPGRAMLLAMSLTTDGVGSVGAGPVVHHEPDRDRFAGLGEVVEELLAARPFAELVTGHSVGPPGGVHHWTSTCRIGVVVDDDGRVDGLANVHVVDAAAFPDIPRTNPYLPTLMLAERLAARLLAR